MSATTVLEVSTHCAQDWLDEQEFASTPSSWSRRARHYFFNYLPQELVDTAHYPIHGLKLLNDGDWIIYPGSMYEDGRLVHWEYSPDDLEMVDLPPLFFGPPAGTLLS